MNKIDRGITIQITSIYVFFLVYVYARVNFRNIHFKSEIFILSSF